MQESSFYMCLHDLSLEDYLIFVWLMGYPGCFHFVSRGTAPPFPIWEDFTLLSLQAWLHMTPPFLFHYGCIHTRWSSSCGACHLPWEAGALDRLGSFFYLVLITASVQGHHLASSRLNMVSFVMGGTGNSFPQQGHDKNDHQQLSFCCFL